jgi:hypothetical protein
VQLGDADIPAYGGSNNDHYELVSVNGEDAPILTGTGASNSACGSIDDLAACGGAIGNPHGRSRSIVKNLDLLDGLITADALDVQVSSLADGSVADVDYQTTFVNLVIDTTPLTGMPTVISHEVEPNTTYVIPLGPVTITIILNEQVTNTQGATDAEGTVNAIHVIETGPDGVLTGELIVASAYSGSHA